MNRLRMVLFLALILSLAAGSPGLLAQTREAGWVPAWIDESGDLSEEGVKQVLDSVATEDPQNLVFLVHGFATSRDRSTLQYDDLAPRLRAAFQRLGRRVSVVGVQWDSETRGGLLALLNQYEGKVPQARRTGRLGFRRLLLAVRERFPDVPVSVLAHSMGCEVMGAAAVPEMRLNPASDEPGGLRPEAELHLNVVVLAGSDLDYDVTWRSGVPLSFRSVNLVWMTMSRSSRRHRDKVLELRALVRGTAMGSTLPRMTAEQYRAMFGARKAVFDGERIPPSHDLLKYYDDVRLARLAGAMAWKADPQGLSQPPDLAEIDRVMEAPDTVEALVPWLDSRRLAPMIYAVWRLENLLGDGEKHLEDEYLTHEADEAFFRPGGIRPERVDSPCALVRAGHWPTATQLARAGAPSWATHDGTSWHKHFRGEVVTLTDEAMEVLTEYGDFQVFDLSSSGTHCTPSLNAIRVGSPVQVTADFNHTALEVRVIPFSDWLKLRVPPAP